MCRPAKDGRHLVDLVQMAIPLCQAAQNRTSRIGPGHPPDYEEWQLAVLIFIAITHRRKSKSSQWRFLIQHQGQLPPELGLKRLPARSTYFRRYHAIHRLYEKAIELQGKKALQEHCTSAKTSAADKSLIPAKGPPWPRYRQRQNDRPSGLDDQAAWGYSPHHGWVWGYSFEVVVSAPAQGKGVVFPLLASMDVASRSEKKSLAEQIPLLPKSTQNLVVDSGHDGNDLAEALEYRHNGKPTGRHYLCPLQKRGGKPAVGKTIQCGRREQLRQHRALRQKFFKSKRGRRLYARRGKSVEPFNQWFKQLFELEHQVWHRGLDNNRTLLLAAIFGYQLLLRYSFKSGRRDGQIQWILDGL